MRDDPIHLIHSAYLPHSIQRGGRARQRSFSKLRWLRSDCDLAAIRLRFDFGLTAVWLRFDFDQPRLSENRFF